jgi:hypothetical protein
MAQYQKVKTKKSSKKWLISGLILLIIAGGVVGWLLWRSHHDKPKEISLSNGQTAIADPNVPGSEDKSDDSTDVTPGTISGPTNSKDYDSNVPGQTSPGVKPTKPTGNFISNPGGPDDPKVTINISEETVCTTTPGAYCRLRFTSGTNVHESPRYKTDGNGSALWEWMPKDYNLTKGTWNVTAVAINGDKTTTASGPQLVVK